MKGFTLWVGGLAELAVELEGALLERGLAVELIAEEARELLPPPAGERADHLRRIGHFCSRLSRNGVALVVSGVTPLGGELREELRAVLDPFLEVLAAGDPESAAAALTVTGDEGSIEEDADRVLHVLERLDCVPRTPGSAYSPEEEREIEGRLRDLGYI